ncbi:MAG: archease [Chloroflexota bacterium]|nr:MAG: archease [Chloroflexota bacterium]
MDSETLFGYKEVPHTADWELEVWAPDLSSLLVQAAKGMYHLAGVKLSSQPRIQHRFQLIYHDPESLLIDFLSELIFLIEAENLSFDQFEIKLNNGQLIADLNGGKLALISKEIKAATFHKLKIQETDQGLVANIVFDV